MSVMNIWHENWRKLTKDEINNEFFTAVKMLHKIAEKKIKEEAITQGVNI